MPSIDVAMARSLRGGFSGILARSLQRAFEERGIEERGIVSSAEDGISSFKETISSWDNCMSVTWCKWPVIALIIIAALMVISVVWCIARCVCCGLSCCCECCYCLKCCGNCCGCCSPPKNRRHKHLDEQPYKNLPPDQGYKSHEPMSASALPFSRPAPGTTQKSDTSQFATYASFDVSKKQEGEDSLPAMPTWGDSESKKVAVEEEVELQHLKKPESNAPLMSGMSPAATPGTRTPVQGGAGPYGPPGSVAASSGYFGAKNVAPSGAASYNNLPGQGYGQMNNGLAQSQASFGTEQSWGVIGTGPAQPRPSYDQGQAQSPTDMTAYSDQGGLGQYGNQPYGRGGPQRSMTNGSNPSMVSGMNQPYGAGGPQRSLTGSSSPSMRGGAPLPDRARGSPAPQPGRGPGSDRQFDPRITPQRTYSPAPMAAQPPPQQAQFPPAPQRTFSPAPSRTYSPAPPQRQWAGDAAPPQRSYSPGPMGGGPQRTYSPGPMGGGPQRTYSPAPQQQQRQWTGDSTGPRAPPYRQFSADSAPNPQRQYSNDAARHAPPQRQYTADGTVSPGPRSPNFSRPTRSNTFDESPNQGQDNSASAYPGYKPYKPTS